MTPIAMFRFIALLCLLFALAPLPSSAQDNFTLEGTAILLTRIAVPAEAMLTIEVTAGESGTPLAEQRIATAGKQQPYPFALTISRSRLNGISDLRLRAAIIVRGQPRFASEAMIVRIAADRISAGEIVLRPYRSLAFASDMICEDKPARFGIENNAPVLEFDGKVYRLREDKSAAGKRYVGTDDKIVFSPNGTKATLTLADGTILKCRKAAANRAVNDPDTLIARGHEPSWQLTIGKNSLSMQSSLPDLTFNTAAFVRDTIDGKPRLTATSGGKKLFVTIVERLCADSMTGMPFPVGIVIEIGSRQFQGCGGQTMNAIEGGWRVIQLANVPVPDGTILTVEFNVGGRVAGRSGCNRYTGGYTLTGEGLKFGKFAGTRMACPPPLMDVEAHFLKFLASVTRVTPGENGQLRLMAGDTQALIIDRAR